jgi:PEP-CTERM motif
MKKFLYAVLIASGVFASGVAEAGFALTPESTDLNFNGAGAHVVDFLVVHNGSGASTLSGYTLRFGSPSNANLGVLPSGVTATGATQGLPIPSSLFSYDTPTNTAAAAGLGFGDADVGTGGTATLFSLNLNLGSAASYTIGVDFQNAQRGGLFATQIGNEFFNPDSPTTDFTFTLTNVSAVPEPTSILTAVSLGMAGMFYRRRRVKLK